MVAWVVLLTSNVDLSKLFHRSPRIITVSHMRWPLGGMDASNVLEVTFPDQSPVRHQDTATPMSFISRHLLRKPHKYAQV